MSSNVIDTEPVEPVGERTKEWLNKLGWTDANISSWTNGTRVLHDLKWCGDDILDDFEILHSEFFVDFSGFEFKKYFPAETSKDAATLAECSFLEGIGLKKKARERVESICNKYPEITFGLIEEMIKQKKWIDP